jgi:hypothetical protein
MWDMFGANLSRWRHTFRWCRTARNPVAPAAAWRKLNSCAASLILVAASVACAASTPPTIAELKTRLSSASAGERPQLCLQIAQRQLTEADKLYAAADDEKAQAALTDVVAYSELARDYSIQSHKHQKQTEIAVRGMARRLTEIMHTLGHDDQKPLQEAITRLQRVRDDLLAAMFPKGKQ